MQKTMERLNGRNGGKRILSLLLCLCMVLSMLPLPSVAAEGCPHHTQHVGCGYVEAKEYQPCTHVHGEECYTVTTVCIHTHGIECYSDGVLPMEGEEKAPDACPHQCSEESGCVTKAETCIHTEHIDCGYVAAVEGQPCGFVCEECAAAQKPVTPVCNCETKCTEAGATESCEVCAANILDCKGAAPEAPETCTHGNALGSCEVCALIARVAAVQKLIDELPEEVTAETKETVESALADVDTAKAALNETEQGQLDVTRYAALKEKLAALDKCAHGNDPETCEDCASIARVAAVQKLIDELPEEVTAETKETVESALSAVDAAKAALNETEQAQLDVTRYTSLKEKLAALNKCAHDSDPLTCEVCASEARVASVQALIDNLPTVEELTEETEAQAREQLAVVKAAVEGLTEEEQAQLKLDKYTDLSAHFEALDAPAEPIVITDWEWIDEWEIIDPETGLAHLPFASAERIADYDSVRELLPWAILVDDEELPLGEWTCENYPEEGAYEGEYIFETTLPEGYVLPDETDVLFLKVVLGDPMVGEVATYTTTSVSYYNENGTLTSRDGVIEIDSNTKSWTDNNWYVVKDTRSITGRITVSGNVSLILKDQCALTVSSGIDVPSGSSLTIYAQSKAIVNASYGTVQEGNTAGILIASVDKNDTHAAIGGNREDTIGGNITIYGGIVQARHLSNRGSGASIHVSTLNVYGGFILAGNTDDIGTTGIKANTINVYGGSVYGRGRNPGYGIYASQSLNIQKGYVKGFVSENVCIYAPTITTGTSGVEIYAPRIETNSDRNAAWNAIVYYPDTTFYGNHTLSSDFTASTTDIVTIASGATVTIPSGITMTNNRRLIIQSGGKLVIESGGKLVNGTHLFLREEGGELINNGTIEGNGLQYYTTYFDRSKSEEYAAGCDELVSNTTKATWGAAGKDSWYAVLKDATISDTIYISGNMTLILGDGATLTALKGIKFTEQSSLTIYAQKGGTGKLNASFSTDNVAIFGNQLTIRGGSISAKGGTTGIFVDNFNLDYGNVTASGSNTAIRFTTGKVHFGVVNANGGIQVVNEGKLTLDSYAVIFSSTKIKKSSYGLYTDRTDWKGLVFEGNQGSVYTKADITSTNVVIPSGTVLQIPEGASLEVWGTNQLTNNGSIYVSGLLKYKGTIPGSGSIYYALNPTGCTASGEGVVRYPDQNGQTYAKLGSTVNLTQNSPSNSQMCTSWGATGITLDVDDSSFTMPANVVTLNPVFEDIVATVGGKNYSDIATALNAADKQGAALQLKKNVTDSCVAYTVENKLIFEGGDFKLDAAITVPKGKSFQMNSGAICCESETQNTLTVNGTLVMTGGTIESVKHHALVVAAGASCRLSGGKIIGGRTNNGMVQSAIFIEDSAAKLVDLLEPGCGYWKNSGTVISADALTQALPREILIAPVMTKTSEPGNVSMTYGNNRVLSFDIRPAKTGDTVSFQWYKNGSAITGASSNPLSLADFNVGSYSFYCVASCQGYKWQSKTVTVIISKAVPALALKSSLTKVYDGAAYSDVPYTVTPGLENLVTVTYKNSNGTSVKDNKPVHAGTYTVSVTVAESQNYQAKTVNGQLIITPKTVEINWGNTTFTYNKTALCPAPTVGNAVSGDKVQLTASGAQINAGTYTATVTSVDNSDYRLPDNASTTFTIERKAATITGVGITSNSKVYDGTTTAIVAGVPTVEGILSGDTVSLKLGTAAYEDKNVGVNKAVKFEGFELVGKDAGNYTASQPASVEAAITPRDVTLTVTVANKYYDGGTGVTISSAVLTGVLQNDEVTVVNGEAAFESEGPGDDIKINFKTSFTLSGKDGGNYQLTNPAPAGLMANIYQKYSAVKGTHYTVNSNDWLNTDFEVTAADGFKLSESSTDAGPWSDTLKVSTEGEGSLTFYVRNTKNQAVSESAAESYKIDKTKPTGTILFDGADVTDRGGERTSYRNASIPVTITSGDNLSGVASLAYCKSDKLLSTEQMGEIKNWQSGSQVTIPAALEESFYLYTRVIDNAGNTAYFRSCQVTFDLTAPVISGVTNSAVYYTSQTAAVSDANLETLTLNGKSVVSPVLLTGDTDQEYTIIAADKAGNSTTVTVTMKELSTLFEPVKDVTDKNVTKENRQALEKAKSALEALPENAAEAEKQKAGEALKQINQALETLDNASKVIEKIAKLPASVQPDETDKEDQIKKARAAYDALNDNEKRLVDITKLTRLELALVDYKFLEGSGSSWNQESEKELTFKANGALTKFKEVKLDGKTLDTANYSTASGSTIITLSPDFLQSLSVGEHRLQVFYSDGKTEEASFEVKHSPNYLNLDNSDDFAGQTEIWVDGVAYPVETQDEQHVNLPQSGELLTVYTYKNGSSTLSHDNYPTGMKVYRIERTQDGAVLTPIPELDNLLQYSGSSIRVTGNRGIRMITSLTQANKTALTGSGLAGFTLDEYGTVLCKASQLNGASLTLANGKHNFAYKKGVADPVFSNVGGLIQYTNVLVGFSQEECSEDILMRPYIILRDARGQAITLYGGTVSRSIRYIAWQNQNTYKPGTAAYNYVHELMGPDASAEGGN